MCDQVGLTTTAKSPKSLVTHELLKFVYDSPAVGWLGRGRRGGGRNKISPRKSMNRVHAPCRQYGMLYPCCIFAVSFILDRFPTRSPPYSSNARRSQFNTADWGRRHNHSINNNNSRSFFFFCRSIWEKNNNKRKQIRKTHLSGVVFKQKKKKGWIMRVYMRTL